MNFLTDNFITNFFSEILNLLRGTFPGLAEGDLAGLNG